MSKTILTAKSITDAMLETLENNAGTAGDVETAAIAHLARTGAFDIDDWALNRDERRSVESMTQAEAIDRCVAVYLDTDSDKYVAARQKYKL